jgi:hypothetical protein
MRLSADGKTAIAQNRLLLLSPFQGRVRRPIADVTQTRNSFVTAIADTIFIAYAATGSKTERFAPQVLAWSKLLLTLDSPENNTLVALGAKPVPPNRFTSLVDTIEYRGNAGHYLP